MSYTNMYNFTAAAESTHMRSSFKIAHMPVHNALTPPNNST